MITHVINLLNEALALDPVGFSRFIFSKSPVSSDFIKHPSIQCSLTKKNVCVVSTLGFLNGLFTYPHVIYAQMDDAGVVVKFSSYEEAFPEDFREAKL